MDDDIEQAMNENRWISMTKTEASWLRPSDRTANRGSGPFIILLDENKGISDLPEIRMEG